MERWLKNFKIGSRLLVAFGCIFVVMCIILGTSWWGISLLHKERAALNRASDRALAASQLYATLKEVRIKIWETISNPNADGRIASREVLNQERKKYATIMDDLKKNASSDQEKALLEGVQIEVIAGKNINNKIIENGMSGNINEAVRLSIVEGTNLMKGVTDSSQKYVDYCREVIQQSQTAMDRTESKVLWVLVIMFGISTVATILFVRLFKRIYTSDIANILAHTDLMSRGDFSMDMREEYQHRKDEMGELGRMFQKMVVAIRELMREVRSGVETLASSATQLSASAEQMAGTTQEIAHNTESQKSGSEQMAAAINELSSSIEEMSQTTTEALTLMESALEATQRGDAAGVDTQEAMQGVTSTAQRIASAISVITEIANQTNLLSLNAAIEAAKAGEQGKGFAVVAEEVRKLAERSASSAKDIAEHIRAAQIAVERGSATVATTGALLKQIRTNLEGFADQARQSALATQEQSRVGAEVARRVDENVHQAAANASATTQMSATTHEIARTASDLADLGERLQAMLKRFRI